MTVPGQVPGAGRTGSVVGGSVVPADVHIEGRVTGEAWGGRGGQTSGGQTAHSPRLLRKRCSGPAHRGWSSPRLCHSPSHQTPGPAPPAVHFRLHPPDAAPPFRASARASPTNPSYVPVPTPTPPPAPRSGLGPSHRGQATPRPLPTQPTSTPDFLRPRLSVLAPPQAHPSQP